jgi:hypothetical protein
MTPKAGRFIIILFFAFCFISGCSKIQSVNSWERHCESCHDGKTMLNGKVVPDKEQMKAKYKTLDEFAKACAGAPACMNIVKHEEKLLREAGTEIGLKNIPEK